MDSITFDSIAVCLFDFAGVSMRDESLEAGKFIIVLHFFMLCNSSGMTFIMFSLYPSESDKRIVLYNPSVYNMPLSYFYNQTGPTNNHIHELIEKHDQTPRPNFGQNSVSTG